MLLSLFLKKAIAVGYSRADPGFIDKYFGVCRAETVELAPDEFTLLFHELVDY